MNYWYAPSLIPPPSSLFITLSHDPRAQLIQSLLDPLVTAIDLMDVVDHALALGAECREKQCHAGADVGAGDLCAGEPIAADDDRPMRIAKNDPSPHRNQFVRKEKARLEHFLEDHHR